MKSFLLFALLSAALPIVAQPLDSLLVQLDDVVSESDSYESIRLGRIADIHRWLSNPDIEKVSEYRLNQRLYDEYESYVCDSAWRYIDRNIAIARELGNVSYINESIIRRSHILATRGLFTESESELLALDPNALATSDVKAMYYKSLSDAYLYQAENNDDNPYFYTYESLSRQYADSALHYAAPGSYLRLITLAPELVKDGRIGESLALLYDNVECYAPDSHERSVIYSLMSFAYYCEGDSLRQMECLIRSAMTDIRCAVMENRALREISEILFRRGDVERANRYLKKSLSDATKFNSRLRNMQSSRMMPVIDAAYQSQREEQQAKMRRYLWVISALSVLLLLALVYIYRQVRRTDAANRQLQHFNSELSSLNAELVDVNGRMQRANVQLRELNHIKEEYVARFMELCSVYLAEFDSFRRKLHKAAGSTKISDLQRMLSSDESVEAILKEFYRTFDKSFLNLFPDFVSQVNRLFPEEAQIELRSDERFNTEVRILSLLRLGITDSEKIASFLRCSITTIYTYRSKMKNRSLCPDDFETKVMSIGAEK